MTQDGSFSTERTAVGVGVVENWKSLEQDSSEGLEVLKKEGVMRRRRCGAFLNECVVRHILPVAQDLRESHLRIVLLGTLSCIPTHDLDCDQDDT